MPHLCANRESDCSVIGELINWTHNVDIPLDIEGFVRTMNPNSSWFRTRKENLYVKCTVLCCYIKIPPPPPIIAALIPDKINLKPGVYFYFVGASLQGGKRRSPKNRRQLVGTERIKPAEKIIYSVVVKVFKKAWKWYGIGQRSCWM